MDGDPINKMVFLVLNPITQSSHVSRLSSCCVDVVKQESYLTVFQFASSWLMTGCHISCSMDHQAQARPVRFLPSQNRSIHHGRYRPWS